MNFGLVKKWHAQEVESTQDWGTEISSLPFPAMFLTRLTVRGPRNTTGKIHRETCNISNSQP
jgi:hypothetical protein